MRIVLTGHKGQLGRALLTALAGHDIFGIDIPEHDITRPAEIIPAVLDFRPDLIVHPAAYTDVDGCEKNPDLAFAVNTLGSQYLALAAQMLDVPLLYVSSNEVFDGQSREFYREWDRPAPMSVYARSKWAGEQAVRSLLRKFYIVRTAWVFANGGNNFITKIIAGARKHGALRVAADEFGSPTYAPDLAVAIARLVQTGYYGIYHFTNDGFCSRYEYAREILRRSGLAEVPVTPILSSQWPRPSTPPLHALLRNSAGAAIGITLRPWQDALAAYFVAENG